MKTLAVEMHDPRIPNLDEDADFKENPFLEEFLNFCKSNPISAVRDLEAAPREVKNLLRAHHLRPKMMKHIMVNRGSQ